MRLPAAIISFCMISAVCLAAEGDWPTAAGTPDALRFSPLDEINITNVSRLAPAFTFNTGLRHGQESATLVVGNTLYFVTPFPKFLYALDLTERGAPPKWKFNPHADPASQGVACCDSVNRGPAFAQGKVVFNTLDGQTIAVDAATGQGVVAGSPCEYPRW